MNNKSTLDQILKFYHGLDWALATYSPLKDCKELPIVVGGDAAYLRMREKLGSGFRYFIEVCKNEFEKENVGRACEESRFSDDYTALFNDADIYLPSPCNVTPLQLALQKLGYRSTNKKAVEQNGCMVFLNKTGNAHPVKVDVLVKTKHDHTRPKSGRAIETILPQMKGKKQFGKFDEINNLSFITIKSVQERIDADIESCGDKVPVKMLQDRLLLGKFLTEVA